VDRHRFDANPDSDPNFHVDADPDPDWHQKMPIFMRILPQVSHILEFFFTFSHSFAILQCFIFLISVKHDQIFIILDSILKFCGKKVQFINFFMCLALIPIWIGRICIGMPWMPFPIRIRQNDADPSRSGPTTQGFWVERTSRRTSRTGGWWALTGNFSQKLTF
jgi:hypothetical protein